MSLILVCSPLVKALKWLSVPGLLLYMWLRLFRGQKLRRTRRKARGVKERPAIMPGGDSPWYALESALCEHVLPRGRGEPPLSWWRRQSDRVSSDVGALVTDALRRHYRYRFGGSATVREREALRTLVTECVKRLEREAQGQV